MLQSKCAAFSRYSRFLSKAKNLAASRFISKKAQNGSNNMAQRAETLNPTIEAMPRVAPPVPVQTKSRTYREQQDMLSTITQLAASKYQSARAGAAHSYRVLLQNSRVRASALKRRFDTIRNEKPLQLIAVVAGTAFALGIALRIWRSNHNG